MNYQVEYWNRVGITKQFTHPVNLERLKALVSKSSGILDFGCGYGRVLGILQSDGYSNLIGYDAAPEMVRAARQRYPQISFHDLPNSPKLPLPDASVDSALLFTVLTCVPDDEDQRAILKELRRVLRSGGILYISDMWLQTDERNLQRYAQGRTKHGTYGVFDLAEGLTLRHHNPEWIEDLTREYEFVALDHMEVATMNGHMARGFQWFGRRL